MKSISGGVFSRCVVCCLTLMLSPPDLAIGEEECLYDQNVFVTAYQNLQRKYPGSIYLEREKALEIHKGRSRIILWYGGCEHIGITIKYYGDRMAVDIGRERLFRQAVNLIKEFDQGLANYHELQKLLQEKKYQQLDDNVYLVLYPLMSEFSISYGADDLGGHVEVSYYQ